MGAVRRAWERARGSCDDQRRRRTCKSAMASVKLERQVHFLFASPYPANASGRLLICCSKGMAAPTRDTARETRRARGTSLLCVREIIRTREPRSRSAGLQRAWERARVERKVLAKRTVQCEHNAQDGGLPCQQRIHHVLPVALPERSPWLA